MEENTKLSLEKLKQVRGYMKRNSGQMQLIIIHDELMELIKNEASISAIYKYFVDCGKFDGCYDSFAKNLKEYLGRDNYLKIKGSWKTNRKKKLAEKKGKEKNAKTK